MLLLLYVEAAIPIFALKIAAKLLQIKTWLLLTAYELVIALSNGTIADPLRCTT